MFPTFRRTRPSLESLRRALLLTVAAAGFCAAVGILGATNEGLRFPAALGAQLPNRMLNAPHHIRYKLIDLGTFGGPNSSFNEAFQEMNGTTSVRVISENGAAAGFADTATADPLCYFDDCFFPNAFQFHKGALTNLGTLPNSLSSQAFSISSNGLTAGFSENGETDPLTGLPEMRGVLWGNGRIVNVGTLEGGYESLALAVNNAGQAVGIATNLIPDPFSFLGAQIRAFLWQNGVMRDLGTLGGPEADAFLVNERGQVAGISFPNSTPIADNGGCMPNAPAQEPFFWSNGVMVGIGGFGGTCGITNALNNRGQVVGQSYTFGNAVARAFLWDRGALRDLGTLGGQNASAEWLNDAGDVVGFADIRGAGCAGLPCVHHAFLWRHGAMMDLGTLQGDPCSRAQSINSRGQIVGFSVSVCGGEASHALLWEAGEPGVDLNTLIAPGSSLQLTLGLYINERGEIAGNGILANGDTHAFLLIPCSPNVFENCRSISVGARGMSGLKQMLTPRVIRYGARNPLTHWGNRMRVPQE